MAERKTGKDAESAEKPQQVHTVGLSTTGNGKEPLVVDGSDERVKALVARGISEEDAIRLVRQINFF
jgi:hypothetical protein